MSDRSSSRALSPVRLCTLVVLAALGVGSIAASTAAAVTITWTNAAGGVWSDPGNWDPANVPDAVGETAVLPTLGSAYQVTLDASPSIDALTLAGGATLDLAGYSTTSITNVYNSGTVVRYRGVLDGSKFHNQGGGILSCAPGDSITTAGTITNDGTIVIGPVLTNALHLTSSTVLIGSGTLLLEGGRVACGLGVPQTTLWLTNGNQHTVRGAGTIIVPVDNYGLLHADAGQTLRVKQYLLNSGTTRVTNSSLVEIDFPLVKNSGEIVAGAGGGAFEINLPFGNSGTIDNLSTGELVSDGGDLRIRSNALVNGTVHRTSGTGVVRLWQATPQNLRIAADGVVLVDGQIDLMAAGSSLINDGLVRVTGQINTDGTMTNGVAFSGSGVVQLENGTLNTPRGYPLTNAAGHTIRGCGTITANLINQGTLDVDCTGGVLWIQDRSIRNENVLNVKRGTLWVKTVDVVNEGTLTTTATGQARFEQGSAVRNTGGTLVAEGNVLLGWNSTAKIVGGVLSGSGSGSFRNHGETTLEDVTIGSGAVFITQSGKTTRAKGAQITIEGTNRITTGGAFIADPATDYLQTSGETALEGGSLTVPQGLMLLGALRGRGTVTADVYNSGIVIPDAGTGLAINGNYFQLPEGELGIAVSSDGSQFSHLTVSGAADLDGRLVVATGAGFNPGAGQDFGVMAFGSHEGAFVECVGADPGAGLVMVPIYDEATFTVQIQPVTLDVDDRVSPRALRFYTRGAELALDLPEAAEVSMRAYDVSGREVARLAEGRYEPGTHRFALRAQGRTLPSGVYFARAVVRNGVTQEARSTRMILVK